jgi:hypothetical protein
LQYRTNRKQKENLRREPSGRKSSGRKGKEKNKNVERIGRKGKKKKMWKGYGTGYR